MWNKVYRIKPNGEREIVSPSSTPFSCYARMVNLWIYLHASCEFFNLIVRRKAEAKMQIGKSGRSVFFEEPNGDVLICSVPKGVSVHDGRQLGTKFDYTPIYYKLMKK